MTASALQTLLQSGDAPRLIHVLPGEVFAAERIAGSENACVYEMAFLEQVRAHVPDTGVLVVVYGAGEGSLDAAAAVEKLKEAGYTRVEAFEGGLAEWRAAGLPLEGDGKLPEAAAVPDGTFRLDAGASVIRWTGRNLFNAHYGTVKCSDGEVVVREGRLVSARFTVDMKSIACEDLTDPGMNAMLIAHLQSGDFFEVGKYPAAEFVAGEATGGVERIKGCTDGVPNYLVRGTFTMRGISRPLVFQVLVAPGEDGRRITAQGQFELDRTEFGSQYGSGKLFRFLGKHLVNDYVLLQVKICAERVGG